MAVLRCRDIGQPQLAVIHSFFPHTLTLATLEFIGYSLYPYHCMTWPKIFMTNRENAQEFPAVVFSVALWYIEPEVICYEDR